MLDLTAPMKEIQKRRQECVAEYEKKIKGFDEAYRILYDMNEVCPNCGGKGWVLRDRACAEDDRPNPDDPSDRKQCNWCKGTGKADHKI